MNSRFNALLALVGLAVWPWVIGCGQPHLAPAPGAADDAGEPPDAGAGQTADAGAGDAGGYDAGAFDAGAAAVDAGAERCVEPPSTDAGFSRHYVRRHGPSPLQDRAFFLATVFDSEATWRARLSADPVIGPIARAHENALRGAPEHCQSDVACYSAAVTWSADEITQVANALPSALGPCETAKLARGHLRPSGDFSLHDPELDGALVGNAWKETASAANRAFGSYAATLDGATLNKVVSAIIARHPDSGSMAFYEPLIQVAVAAALEQGRDEAVRYEPIDQGQNAAAVAYLATVTWADFASSAIVVPGQGPNGSEPLNPIGRERCDLAKKRFDDKRAPVLILSGGHVHPDRTGYSEAIEMKKYLMSQGVAEQFILVDPYARHTTTNLRNASRLLARVGAPLDKPVLVTSDIAQSFYISSHAAELDGRCQSDLGYLPYFDLKRVSANDSSYRPNPQSMQVTANDLLDP